MNQAARGTTHEEKVRNDAASNEQFRSIWESALKEYRAETGHDLQSLKSIHNVNDLSRTMRATEDGFAKTRKGDSGYQRTRDILKSCVLPLQAASSLAAGALGMTPFAPAATIFGAGMYLIDACDNVSKAYDFVTELLQECKTYVDRLKKLSEIEMRNDFVLKLTAILKFILEVFAECEKVMTRGRGKIWADKAFLGKGKDEILQSSLERLKRYFTEEEMYTVAQIYVTTEKTSTNVFKLVDFNKTSQVQRVVDSLPRGPFDVAAKQVEDNAKSSVLSPVWVEEIEAYQEWIRNTSPQHRWLWGLGSVGVGKTTLVSYLATKMSLQGPSFITPNMRPTLVNTGHNDLSSQYSLPQTAVAVFYGDYETKGEQRPDLVFQCLIRQLLQQLQVAAIDRAVVRSEQIDDLKKANTASSFVSWSSILNDLASEFQRTFIFVDALDKEESGYEDLVARLHQLKSPSVKLFVTSRDDQSMRNDAEYRKAITITIPADTKIITAYVHNRLERIRDHAETTETIGASALPSFLHNQSDFEHVLKTIMSTAQGNFYYAETSINLLLQERKLENLRHKMTKLTGNLSEVIRLDVERVEQQSDQYNRKVGLKTLMLAAFAGRPLTIPEIQNAVVLFVHPATRESARQLAFKIQFFSIEYIAECSCRLLRVDERNRIVHVDEAIKSYCTRSGMFDTAHYEIAEICLTFLDRMSFQLRCRSKEEHDLRRQECPLYFYAARYWAFHMREAGESLFFNTSAPVTLYTLLNRKLFCDAIASALHENLPPRLWNWAGQDTWQVMQVSKSPTLPAVHLLAYLNLPQTLDWWLRKNPDDIHAKTATGMTPLYLACLLGHTRIAESLLFDYNADPTVKGSPPSNYCLHVAINSQSTEIVERILYINSNDTLVLSTVHGRRPLSEAVTCGDIDIARMVIDEILARPDGEELLLIGDNDGRTALHEIAVAPNPSIEAIKMLVGAPGGKAFLRKQTIKSGDSALHLAAIRGNGHAVKQLLRLGADPNMPQNHGLTPLMLAVKGLHINNEETIRSLVTAMKDHDHRNNIGRTTWHIAARHGRNRNLELLIELTPKSIFHSKDKNGETPIRAAVTARAEGWLHCVEVLLRDCSGEIGVEDANAVLDALVTDDTDVAVRALELLIEQRPVESWPYCEGQTTLLHKVSRHGSLEMMEMVWARLGDESPKVLEYHDAEGPTPLILVAATSVPDQVAYEKALFLLEQGAQVNARDSGGRTALHFVVARDLPDLAAVLLVKGADFRLKDNDGFGAFDLMKAESMCFHVQEVIAAKAMLAQDN